MEEIKSPGNVNLNVSVQSIIDCFNDSVILFKKEPFSNSASFLEVNNSALELFGYEKDEFLGLSFENIFAAPTYNLITLARDLSRPSEGFCISKKGASIPVEFYTKDFNIDDNTFVLLLKDTTEKRKNEEQIARYIQEMHENKDLMERNGYELVLLNVKLEESEEELRATNASKDKFFSIIAHDLKSPFASFMGLSELLAEDFNDFEPDEMRTLLFELNKNARNVYSLLENLLSWSRIQTGRMENDPERLQPTELVKKTFYLYEQLALQKKIGLITDIHTEKEIFADRNMIETVLRNLTSNALKFTHSDGRIIIAVNDMPDNMVEFSVTDSGIGMDEKSLKKLFKIDVHHTTVGTNNEKGTGLGLILCKELVEKNNGTINVESKEGEGTTFSFLIPAVK